VKFSRRQFLGAAPAALCAQNARPAIDGALVVGAAQPGARRVRRPVPALGGQRRVRIHGRRHRLADFPGALRPADAALHHVAVGWHTIPNPSGQGPSIFGWLCTIPMGARSGMPPARQGRRPLFNWLRENPHRLHLGKIGFAIEKPGDVAATVQTLDLWTGTLRSEFQWNGQRVVVETACHPQLDLLAVRVRGRVPVTFEFPYGSAPWTPPTGTIRKAPEHGNGPRREPARPSPVSSTAIDTPSGIAWQTAGEMKREGPHRFVFAAGGGTGWISSVSFGGPAGKPLHYPPPKKLWRPAAKHWSGFWSGGGAVDLSGKPRPARSRTRAPHRAFSIPDGHSVRRLAPRRRKPASPATVWYGKFHLEMHFWHARALRPVGPRAAARAQPGLVQRDPALRARKSAHPGIHRRALAEK